ncbi:MAG: RfaG [Acidobacteria bacterium]|nr:RfaG [Acidobacteriota bacterium]
MKILQLSSAKTFGGGERHLADLANALTARGHEVHIALRPGSPLLGDLVGLAKENITTLPLRNALDAVSARKLARYVRDHQIEIVHAHLARDYPLASYATRRNPGSKLIITRHVLFPLNRLHSITLSAVARVIAVSSAVKRELEGLLPAERIMIIPNGIELQRFEVRRSPAELNDFRQRWSIRKDDLLIGTVGELTPLKGHEDFLRAASIILRQFPNAQFLIAGVDGSRKGNNLAALESLIAQLNLGSSVRIVGWVDDLSCFYSGLDIFVSASHTESFGLAIAEAMASEVPVVATETEGAKEIIADEARGVLVPVGAVELIAAAVIDLLTDESKRRRVGKAGRESIKARFSLERMVVDTEKIYEEALRK